MTAAASPDPSLPAELRRDAAVTYIEDVLDMYWSLHQQGVLILWNRLGCNYVIRTKDDRPLTPGEATLLAEHWSLLCEALDAKREAMSLVARAELAALRAAEQQTKPTRRRRARQHA